jgi:hypothetical protein
MPVWLRRFSGANRTVTLDGGTEQPMTNAKKISAAEPQPKTGKAGFTAEAQSAKRFLISNSPLRVLRASAVKSLSLFRKFIVPEYSEKHAGKKANLIHLTFS